MNKYKTFFPIILIVIFFTIINLYIFSKYSCSSCNSNIENDVKTNTAQSNQNEIKYISYVSLYYPANKLIINGFDHNLNEIMLKLSRSVSNKWEIFTDNENPYYFTGGYPKIKLLSGEHTYKITPVPQVEFSDITLTFTYTPQGNDSPTPSNYYLSYSSIPVGQFQQFPIAIWESIDLKNQIDIESAKQTLKQEANITTNLDTRTKVERISKFLLDQLDDKRGTPSKKIYLASPYQQYQMAKNGESKIWCRQFADIYTFFANAAGIPTRRIEVNGQSDGVLLTGHGFAESYIKECNQWLFIDLTSRKIFLKNTKGDFINTLDLYYINLTGSYKGIIAHVYKNGDLIDIPYSEDSSSEQQYFRPEVGFIYFGEQGQKMCTVIPSLMVRL